MPSALQSMTAMPPPAQGDMPEPQADDQSTEQEMKPKDSSESPNCIQAPKGLKTPDGEADGGKFEGTFRGYLKDGKLYFDAINNIPVEGSKEEEDKESPEEESSEQDSGKGDMDGEDMAYAKKTKENDAFKKAFHG